MAGEQNDQDDFEVILSDTSGDGDGSISSSDKQNDSKTKSGLSSTSRSHDMGRRGSDSQRGSASFQEDEHEGKSGKRTDSDDPEVPEGSSEDDEGYSEEELEDHLSKRKNDPEKRIRELTYKYREEERQRHEALNYARSVMEQKAALERKLSELTEAESTRQTDDLKSRRELLERNLQRALEDGDSAEQVKLNSALQRLAVEEDRVARSTYELQQLKKQQEEQASSAQQQKQPVRKQAPDPKAQDWASRNTWFGQDKVRTAAAFALHSELVETEGYDPSSDEYYQELDKRLRNEFPNKFKDSNGRESNGRGRVAEANRSATNRSSKSGGKRKITLSPSQQAVAKSLGVSVEDYARELMRLQDSES